MREFDFFEDFKVFIFREIDILSDLNIIIRNVVLKTFFVNTTIIVEIFYLIVFLMIRES